MERSPPTTRRSLVITSTLIESGPAVLALADIKVREDFNPRDNAIKADIPSLVKSIGARGLLQPLVVTPNDTGYYLVDGHRRFLAISELGYESVPVIVRAVSDETEQLIDAVTANVQRADLSIVEEARAFQRMREQGKNVKQIASELGVSQKLVSARLSLLTLPNVALSLVESGDLQPGHVPTLVEMAKVSPGLAGGVATVIVQRNIAPAKFAANPFEQVAQGFIPELDIWIVGTPCTVILASVHADLDELDRARLKEIGELNGTATPHALKIDVQPGVAFGCVYVPPGTEDAWNTKYAVCDRAWMVQAIKAAIVEIVTALRERNNAPAPATVIDSEGNEVAVEPVSEEAVKEAARAERKLEQERRLRSHAVNLNLGAELFTGLASVELTKDVALLVTRLVLGNETRSVFLAGMRFCDPKVAKEIAGKDGKPGKLEYELPGGSEEQAAYLMEFIGRGDTGEQVLGRLLQVLAMAGLADQTAVAQSSRPGRPSVAFREDRALANMLGAKLPVPIREWLDEADAANAKIAADAADRNAKRAAEEEALLAAEDASMKAVVACEDPAEQKVLALAHADEYGDPGGLLDDILGEGADDSDEPGE